jgi:hypothetical protein
LRRTGQPNPEEYVSTEPTAQRYRDGTGRSFWRIVCGEVVLKDGIESDRVAAETLAVYRNDRADILAALHARPVALRRRIAAWLRVPDNAMLAAQLVGSLLLAGVVLAAVLLGSQR